jgi:hypothetical protein
MSSLEYGYPIAAGLHGVLGAGISFFGLMYYSSDWRLSGQMSYAALYTICIAGMNLALREGLPEYIRWIAYALASWFALMSISRMFHRDQRYWVHSYALYATMMAALSGAGLVALGGLGNTTIMWIWYGYAVLVYLIAQCYASYNLWSVTHFNVAMVIVSLVGLAYPVILGLSPELGEVMGREAAFWTFTGLDIVLALIMIFGLPIVQHILDSEFASLYRPSMDQSATNYMGQTMDSNTYARNDRNEEQVTKGVRIMVPTGVRRRFNIN